MRIINGGTFFCCCGVTVTFCCGFSNALLFVDRSTVATDEEEDLRALFRGLPRIPENYYKGRAFEKKSAN